MRFGPPRRLLRIPAQVTIFTVFRKGYKRLHFSRKSSSVDLIPEDCQKPSIMQIVSRKLILIHIKNILPKGCTSTWLTMYKLKCLNPSKNFWENIHQVTWILNFSYYLNVPNFSIWPKAKENSGPKQFKITFLELSRLQAIIFLCSVAMSQAQFFYPTFYNAGPANS